MESRSLREDGDVFLGTFLRARDNQNIINLTRSTQTDISQPRSGNLEHSSNQRSGILEPSSNQRSGNLEPSSNQKSSNPEPNSDQRSGNLEPSSNLRTVNIKPSSNQKSGNLELSSNQRSENLEPSSNQILGNLELSSNQRSGNPDYFFKKVQEILNQGSAEISETGRTKSETIFSSEDSSSLLSLSEERKYLGSPFLFCKSLKYVKTP